VATPAWPWAPCEAAPGAVLGRDAAIFCLGRGERCWWWGCGAASVGRAAAAPARSLAVGTVRDRGKPEGKRSLGKREERCVCVFCQ